MSWIPRSFTEVGGLQIFISFTSVYRQNLKNEPKGAGLAGGFVVVFWFAGSNQNIITNAME